MPYGHVRLAMTGPIIFPGSSLGCRLLQKKTTTCFGAALTLPGEFIDVLEKTPQEFVDSLRAAPPPPSSRPRSYAQVAAARPASVLRSKFVYITRGGTVPSLQPLRALPGGEQRRQVLQHADGGQDRGGFR
jgi:hypothetical protein